MSTKKCNVCEQEKSLACYSKDKSKKDGICGRCKECDKKATYKWKDKNTEYKLQYDKEFYYKHKAKYDKMVDNKHHSIDPAIYMIKNVVNGKCYIGTSKAPYRRVYQHLSYREDLNGNYPSPYELACDVEKYGKESFVWGVIEHVTKENKFTKEREYISIYQPEYNNRK